ncbi:hypothetical protein PF005_g28373 [Phytophthora fragariae]|uniref:Secreted protein n=1 Tax=Phytophthora fragariae TaxID=53985 RepID=A0A6A3DG93_9STRA|nr:hypothetical protein PF003_g35610 [Phytophthora fragariae]KAE8920802.1 hypothetical protein PF009_g28909 [Phytophthora fragariae]KAE8950851.1 hypothetical protein PF011_g33117 [Phytophthora fragariae]KAE9066048.1 hypothetical protein PF010_g27961 [Phytophthora fragariae]KAE9066717.1 hypothetical protein PF007_g28337 [Phytophthora fragariae]
MRHQDIWIVISDAVKLYLCRLCVFFSFTTQAFPTPADSYCIERMVILTCIPPYKNVCIYINTKCHSHFLAPAQM